MDVNLLSGLLSLGTISALIATGAFVQKSKQNSEDVLELKKKIEELEENKVEFAKLSKEVNYLNERFADLKGTMSTGFAELKGMLKAGVGGR